MSNLQYPFVNVKPLYIYIKISGNEIHCFICHQIVALKTIKSTKP